MSTIWIRHAELGLESEVPESALPFWRQSGWQQLTDEELAAREQAVADEHAEAERSLRAFTEGPDVVALPPVSEPEPAVAAAHEFVPDQLLDESAPPTEDVPAIGRQTTKGND